VAMPHLRGKWSPTKAILRTMDVGTPWLPGELRAASVKSILRVGQRVEGGSEQLLF
jgi:hypothetical protein